MAEKLERNIKALGWVSFFTDVHSEAILPLLPLFITQVLGLNHALLGLIEGIADSTASLLKVASGWYSDRIRLRKHPTTVGYVLSTAAKPLFAFSMTGAHVLGIRFLDRVGKGIRTAPRDALIADSIPTYSFGRAFGFHRMMDTLGATMGTLLAYLALSAVSGSEEYRIRAVFLFATLFGVMAVLVLLIFVREPARVARDMANDAKVLQTGLRSSRFVFFIAVNSLFHLGVFSYAFFLLRAKSLGLTTLNIPLIYLFYNIVYAIMAMPMGRLSDLIGRKSVLLLAYFIYALLCMGCVGASTAWQAWVLFGLYGIHSATVNPVSRAVVAGLSDTRSRGTALGVYHTSVGVTALPASLAAGLLWDKYGAQAPFLLAGMLASIAFAALLVLPLDSKSEEHRDS